MTTHRFESYYSQSGMDSFPSQAVQVGVDQDGSGIYLGRAHHNGDIIPAKVIPAKSAAYIAWGGEEILVNNVEVMREVRYHWVPCGDGAVPPSAVPFGSTADGETLYAGRANHEGSITPGKVQPSHGCCYIPFGGAEVACKSYEVLCLD
ncbi:uncharacterized protein LOC134831623 [Culicoides brevitarsis]|uniref:uncharacterized protein LOC134831623 n=1 Tax=Culicoides brevitarsis TaxID=469753 RepID=UPI00307BC686